MKSRITKRRALLAAGAAASAAGLLLTTAPQAAAAVPYRNWTQTAGNSSGVRFSPCGDWWEVWDNVKNDLRGPLVEYNYKGVKDDWKVVPVWADDNYVKRQFNMNEKYHVYFRIHYGDHTSPTVEYKTSGGC
ncbi:hypothetical protein GCM10010329_60510 [Streptomyces spiroverticillatus]|uniref:Uncharacterized protein n=1 Tax=Streptomyces finlayi TaxID=67296 RepID=A0A918X412_9ACTN|nr:hypothetical protein [Streptomyces finlayi]GHA29107.1 hypothetical protein GCM10010329_60510 [Streptomyces spiroverticillatus]GHD09638.1 hypothetical protein GCM10010334_64170 [Streptomyces finlayi]